MLYLLLFLEQAPKRIKQQGCLKNVALFTVTYCAHIDAVSLGPIRNSASNSFSFIELDEFNELGGLPIFVNIVHNEVRSAVFFCAVVTRFAEITAGS